MKPIEHFRHCPRCGARTEGRTTIPFRCTSCGFVYYFNPTVAAAVIVNRPDERILVITRAKDPARGKLAFPGGFIDVGERAEDGLRREVREEVGLEIGPLEYLCSRPNEYLYEQVSYPVLDLLFAAPPAAAAEAQALDGVAAVQWHDPGTLSPDDLAFPSLRSGLAEYLRRRNAPH